MPKRLTVLMATLVMPLPAAELSWDWVEKREAQTEEAKAKLTELQAIMKREQPRQAKQPTPAEQAAYTALGKALAEHTQMAQVNRREAVAIQAYEKAVNSGVKVEISLAAKELAEAKVARLTKANSIPELKTAIEVWQQAAASRKSEQVTTEKEQAAINAIHEKLNTLGQHEKP